jgi:integrase
LLLDAADRSTSPWLGTWTVLAAATGARNGELCGLEWADLDLDAGTVRFRQALTIVDPAVLPDAAAAAGDANGGAGAVVGRRKELAVGPVKSVASSAILTLPPFAVLALRRHRRQQARLRLAVKQPATVPLRGALAQRVYIHQLPQTAPRLARLIEGVFGPAARATRSVSAPRRAEGNRRNPDPRA